MPKKQTKHKTAEEDNHIATLAEHYLFTCKLLRNEAQKRRKSLKNNKLNSITGRKFIRFYELFLASLYVASEGFLEIGLRDEKIERLIAEHIDSLRLYRNGIFHYQKNNHKKLQFYSLDKMNWAEDLYDALEDYVQTWLIQRHIDAGRVDPTDSNGNTLTAQQIQALIRKSDTR